MIVVTVQSNNLKFNLCKDQALMAISSNGLEIYLVSNETFNFKT